MKSSLQRTAVCAVVMFAAFSFMMVYFHETHQAAHAKASSDAGLQSTGSKVFHRLEVAVLEFEHAVGILHDDEVSLSHEDKEGSKSTKSGDADHHDGHGDEHMHGEDHAEKPDVHEEAGVFDDSKDHHLKASEKGAPVLVNSSAKDRERSRVTEESQKESFQKMDDDSLDDSITIRLVEGGSEGEGLESDDKVMNRVSLEKDKDDRVISMSLDGKRVEAKPKDDEEKEHENEKKRKEEENTSKIDEEESETYSRPGEKAKATKGKLMCNGDDVDSEVIYWKIVPGDAEFESPITPHHGEHHDRYITYEYDQGGWNNVRMNMECIVVLAHATGRTVVAPPQQNLYLLGERHKDKEDKKAHAQMGFEDFFDMSLLYSHKGFHMMHMQDFLAKEGVSGGLHHELPPQNSSKSWGQKLWKYLDKVADAQPEWQGKYLALPDPEHPNKNDFDLSEHKDEKMVERMKAFGGGRENVFYDEDMQKMHHIHFPADHTHRVLQHHYAFVFFANAQMQSFYKRFIRDFMRYRDEIQCAGHNLVKAIRKDSLLANPEGKGEFYALHVRRGDFQFKEVKIGASEIVMNLRDPTTGMPLIPKGALVYISTDDPDGVCKNCVAKRKPCETYTVGKKPQGCPEDTSWDAFKEAGWNVKFLRDYTSRKDVLPPSEVNPNWYGMIESIVCSRAKLFAGTYFSTFTGYIHRLRGYHGLGESTYYHSARYFNHARMEKSVGHGFSREWRAGWTDDEGGLL